MAFQPALMPQGPDRPQDAQVTGDFEMLAADLHVDLSAAQESPNPLQLASEHELHTYWQHLHSITAASLGSETPRGQR
jgi:hypothetical protein